MRSMKLLSRQSTNYNSVGKVFNYMYEESTYDGVAVFEAEVYTESQVSDYNELVIEAYPHPVILHYVYYHVYSFMDWIADLGGFYTLATGGFLFLSSRVAKLANRDKPFHKAQGILPAVSLVHRNAEELANLRYLVLAFFGISEEQYFADTFQRNLTKMYTQLMHLPCDVRQEQFKSGSLFTDLLVQSCSSLSND